MIKDNIPGIYYYYLHSKIWAKTKGELISRKELKNYLFEWRLPKKLRPLIIKELMLLGLIKKEGTHLLGVERSTFNEDKLNKYYQELNIF